MAYKNQAEYRVKFMRRYHERRQYAINHLGGKCVICEATKDLEFDHIDPKTKSRKIDQCLMLRIERLIIELEKCQLLCKPCHTKKSAKESSIRMTKPIKHGTIYAWSRIHCSCRKCLDARITYRKCHRGGTADSLLLKSNSPSASVGANPIDGTNE